ncbi:hypothetical protein MJT46_001727 [Ovis ammon polii x Ovis aries]|nr:hypothetical protein MJT46_001727 [Ovis ammon polii x Ovis aries]
MGNRDFPGGTVEERLLEGKDLTLSTWNAASTQGTAIESPKESALCLSQAYLYGAQGRKTAVVLSAAPSPASCFTERTAVENKNLRLLEAGSHPDHILFGNSNGFNHANSTEQKKPSTRADGRDRGWQQRRGPARVQCTGQPWSDYWGPQPPRPPLLTSLMFQTRNCRAVYTQPHCSRCSAAFLKFKFTWQS